MNRNLQYAFLTFLTLGLLGLVSFVAGTLFAGFGVQGCYPVQRSPENTSVQIAWLASLCLGSLIPSILIWKQRISDAGVRRCLLGFAVVVSAWFTRAVFANDEFSSQSSRSALAAV